MIHGGTCPSCMKTPIYFAQFVLDIFPSMSRKINEEVGRACEIEVAIESFELACEILACERYLLDRSLLPVENL